MKLRGYRHDNGSVKAKVYPSTAKYCHNTGTYKVKRVARINGVLHKSWYFVFQVLLRNKNEYYNHITNDLKETIPEYFIGR